MQAPACRVKGVANLPGPCWLLTNLLSELGILARQPGQTPGRCLSIGSPQLTHTHVSAQGGGWAGGSVGLRLVVEKRAAL